MEIKTLVQFSLISLLLGCSALSEKECNSVDYSKLGSEAQKTGKSKELALEKYVNSCESDHGIKVDRSAFDKAYQASLIKYCTKELPLQMGKDGEVYHVVKKCEDFKIDYRKQFVKGLRFYCKNQDSYSQGLEGQTMEYDNRCGRRLKKIKMSQWKKGFKSFCQSYDAEQAGQLGRKFQLNPSCEKRITLKKKQDYQKGLKSFCTFNMGKELGYMGREYSEVCSGEAEKRLLSGYQVGAQRRTTEQISAMSRQINSLNGTVKNLKEQLEDTNEELEELTGQLGEKDREIEELNEIIETLKE